MFEIVLAIDTDQRFFINSMHKFMFAYVYILQWILKIYNLW